MPTRSWQWTGFGERLARSRPHGVRRLAALALSSSGLTALEIESPARAQSSGLVNVCTGLGVSLPHLQGLGTVTSPFSLVNGLTTTLNGLVDGVNQGVVAPLSDTTLQVGVLDANGNLVSVASPGGCNLGASGLTLDASRGLALGGGRISGLGSLAAPAANAGDVTAIALGNGSTTAAGSPDAIALGSNAAATGSGALALGLRGSVTGADAIALGTDANASAGSALSLGARSAATSPGAVALGSGSVAGRAGLGGAAEAFSGAAVGSGLGAVSVGAAGQERQITNVAGGTQASDAVNLRQLAAVGGNLAAGLGGGARFDSVTGLFTAPSYTVQGGTYGTVGGALGALDLRLTGTASALATTAGDLLALQGQVAALPNLVQQDPASRTIRVGAGTDGGLVSLAGSAGDRRLTGVGAGTGLNDAVNLAQLRGAGNALAASLGTGAGFDPTTGAYQAPSFTVAGTRYGSLDRAIGALDTLSVQYVPGPGGTATNAVDLGRGGLGPVTLRGLAPGAVAAGSTEAVTGGQLYGTNQIVAANTLNLSLLQNAFGTSGAGLIAQDPVTRAITIGAATNGGLITVSGTAGDRRVGGLAAGVNPDEAVNVGQLGAAVAGATGGAAALAVNNQAGSATPVAGGADALALGYGASAAAARSVALGSGSVANQPDTVSVGAVGAERRVVNVANGTLAAGSTDAVNGGQLYGTNQQVAATGAALTDLRGSLDAGTVGLVQQNPTTRTLTVGAATNGTVLDLSGTAGNRLVTGVAAGRSGNDAVNLDQLNAAVGGVTTRVSDLPMAASNQAALGAPTAAGRDALALGYGASAGAARAVALGSGSLADQPDTVSVGRPGAERRIVNVAPGALAPGSTEAVNGAQLYGTNAQLASLLGGGTRYDGQSGLWTGPAYTIRGGLYTDVGGALGAVDAALTRDATDIGTVTRQLAALQAGGAGGTLVQQTSVGGPVTVVGQGGGTVINLAGTDGSRRVGGVADGVAAGDAVNLGQVNAAAQALDARLQDFPVRANNTRGLARPRAVGADAYASGYGAAALGDASVAIGSGALAMGPDASALGHDSAATGQRSTAVGAGSAANGADSAAYGQGSRATADAATALGTASQATWTGATAIGYGAMATADPTTAVGYRALAGGNEASAFGALASATGTNATALGRASNAAGAGATAVGVAASAQGTDSLALGRGAAAGHDNAVAIGAGAATTRANQVALGTPGQTYTLAGVSSGASLAAQTGATGFLTTDAAGNLAATGFGPGALAAMDARIGGLEGSVAGLQAATAGLQRDMRTAFQGTAIALALSGAVLPEGKTYAVSANVGTYGGQAAFGAAAVARITGNLSASGGIGLATTGRSNVGGRGGVTYAW